MDKDSAELHENQVVVVDVEVSSEAASSAMDSFLELGCAAVEWRAGPLEALPKGAVTIGPPQPHEQQFDAGDSGRQPATSSESETVARVDSETSCVTLRLYAPNAMNVSEFSRMVHEVCRNLGIERASRLRVRVLGNEWQLKWTEHLEPIKISDRTTLVPGTLSSKPEANQIYLKPGLAFGYGEHPTTLIAGRWLEAEARGKTVLDLGTGTGVLSLIAARAGATRVLGLDVDSTAVSLARENAVLNELSETTEFRHAEVGEINQDFDVVVANIGASSLLGMCPTLVTRVSNDGKLALAGFLADQVSALRQGYARFGVSLTEWDAREGWVLLVGQRKGVVTVSN